MIIIKGLIAIFLTFVGFALGCSIRMSGYLNTIEDSDYLTYGMTIKDIQKFTKKHKLAAIINDGKILYLEKERED